MSSYQKHKMKNLQKTYLLCYSNFKGFFIIKEPLCIYSYAFLVLLLLLLKITSL